MQDSFRIFLYSSEFFVSGFVYEISTFVAFKYIGDFNGGCDDEPDFKIICSGNRSSHVKIVLIKVEVLFEAELFLLFDFFDRTYRLRDNGGNEKKSRVPNLI